MTRSFHQLPQGEVSRSLQCEGCTRRPLLMHLQISYASTSLNHSLGEVACHNLEEENKDFMKVEFELSIFMGFQF